MGQPPTTPTQAVRDYLLGLQQRIVGAMQAAEQAAAGKPFITDAWVRPAIDRL